jgi:hypothetical protein
MRRTKTIALGVCLALPACGAPQEGEQSLVTPQTAAISVGSVVQISLAAAIGSAPGNIALMTNGKVLASGRKWSNTWFMLDPDPFGNYANSAWRQLPGTSVLGRWANPSAVLRDGRYWSAGGEYTDTPTASTANKGNRNKAEIFDPITETWSALADDPFANLGDPVKSGLEDAPATVLADGNSIIGGPTRYDSNTRIFDVPSQQWRTAAPKVSGMSTEGGAVLLPDGSVFGGMTKFARYFEDQNKWVPTAAPPVSFSTHSEIGPFLLLQTGDVLVLGDNGFNGRYTPSTDTWTQTASTPGLFNHADTTGLVEPNGRVLAAVTNGDEGTGPANIYEYDPVTDVWAQVSGISTLSHAGEIRMLPLPNSQNSAGMGQVLITGDAGKAWLYKPTTTVTPPANWRPTLTNAWVAFGRFHVTGTQLNGLTNGGDLGDDGRMATPYPLVYLTDDADGNQLPVFERSFDFDQMAPRPSTPGAFSFVIAERTAGWANRSWHVHVTASGLEGANSVPLTVTSNRGWGYVPLLASAF